MSDPSRGHGGPAEAASETGLAEVLSAYSIYGGQLGGARRWPDNPLTLTHVRWQGPAGQFLDAVRRAGDDAWLTPGEREAWVQLALHYPNTAAPVQPGPNAPWMPLDVRPEQARALATGVTRSRPAGPQSGWSRPGGPVSQPGYVPFSPGSSGMIPPIRGQQSGPMNGGMGGQDFGGPGSQPRQTTGSWGVGWGEAPEPDVIPCVEIELPAPMGGLATADFARDYARDVAVHFARAARTIPQVRELRAWMRGDRLVLAARMVVGPAGRSVTQMDMQVAANLLADVLTQRTIPYMRLTFADPNEWQAASQMPE